MDGRNPRSGGAIVRDSDRERLNRTQEVDGSISISSTIFDTAGSTDKTLKLYEGHFHDLLNDIDEEVVMGDIKAGSACAFRQCERRTAKNPLVLRRR